MVLLTAQRMTQMLMRLKRTLAVVTTILIRATSPILFKVMRQWTISQKKNQFQQVLIKLKRHKRAQRKKWKQNVVKGKRLRGVPYTTVKGQVKGQKTLGRPCTSAYCQKSTLRSCHSISEEQREWIFTKFWSMESWDERHLYIQTLISMVNVNVFSKVHYNIIIDNLMIFCLFSLM